MAIKKDYSNDKRIKYRDKFKYIPEDLLTAEEQLEILKCKQNYFYFIENYVEIPHVVLGTAPFKPYPFQIRAIKALMNYHSVLIFKSRQTGFSILWGTLLLWGSMFFNNWTAGVVSKTQNDAISFLQKFYDMYKALSDKFPFLVCPFESKNKQSARFMNGSSIITASTSNNALRSATLSLLLLDEAAFSHTMEEVFTSAQPTLARLTAWQLEQEKSNTNYIKRPVGIIINSTPNGKNGAGRWYYEMYKGAKKKGSPDWNKFILIRVHWSEVPEYTKEWYLHQCAQLNWDPLRIAQEYDLKFVGDSTSLIPPSLLSKIITVETPYERIPISSMNNSDFINIYEPVKKECNYIIGVDNAWGDSMKGNNPDNSAFVVIEAKTGTPVCTFKGKANFSELAEAVNKIGRYYNNALIAVERAATGIDTIITLRDRLFYPNLYIHYEYDKTKIGDKKKDAIYGWPTNKKTRPLMLSDLLQHIKENPTINDPELFEQIDSLEWKNGKIQAAQGEHDDLVMAFAIALQVRINVYKIKPGMIEVEDFVKENDWESLIKLKTAKLKEMNMEMDEKNIEENLKLISEIRKMEKQHNFKVPLNDLLITINKLNEIKERKDKRRF